MFKTEFAAYTLKDPILGCYVTEIGIKRYRSGNLINRDVMYVRNAKRKKSITIMDSSEN